MKISKLAVSPTAFLHLKGPDGVHLYESKKPVGIDLFGPGSPEFSQVEARQSARALRLMQENDNKITLAPIEQRRTEAAEDLAALTAAFQYIDYDGPDGKPLAGNALHVAVYSDPTLGWIKEQVTKFVGDWGRFTQGSVAS